MGITELRIDAFSSRRTRIPNVTMSEEVIDTSHQNFCNVVEEMTQSITSVRELIQNLREKYGLHSLLIVRYDHF